eukprot:CFRG3934T1
MQIAVYLVVALVTILFIHRARRKSSETQLESQYPKAPAPTPHWLLGNFPDLQRHANKTGGTHPDVLFRSLTEENGSVVRLVMPFLRHDLVIVSDPDIVKELTYTRNEPKPDILYWCFMFAMGPKSILVSKGDMHKQQRKAFNPGFSSQFLRTIVPAFKDRVSVFCDDLRIAADNNKVVVVHDMTVKLTCEIIMKVAFNTAIDVQGEDKECHEIYNMLKELMDTAAYYSDKPQLRWQLYLPWNAYKIRRLHKDIDTFMYRVIEERLAALTEVIGSTDPKAKVDLAPVYIPKKDSTKRMSRQPSAVELTKDVLASLVEDRDSLSISPVPSRRVSLTPSQPISPQPKRRMSLNTASSKSREERTADSRSTTPQTIRKRLSELAKRTSVDDMPRVNRIPSEERTSRISSPVASQPDRRGSIPKEHSRRSSINTFPSRRTSIQAEPARRDSIPEEGLLDKLRNVSDLSAVALPEDDSESGDEIIATHTAVSDTQSSISAGFASAMRGSPLARNRRAVPKSENNSTGGLSTTGSVGDNVKRPSSNELLVAKKQVSPTSSIGLTVSDDERSLDFEAGETECEKAKQAITAKKDILSIALSYTMQNQDDVTDIDLDAITTQMKTFLFAGHDTVATLTAWCLYFLSQHTIFQEQLIAEVDDLFARTDDFDYEDLNKLKMCGAVVKETLRLYPPGTTVRHVVPGGGPMKGLNLDDTFCFISVYTMQRDKKIWGEDADMFDPSRWLDGRTDKVPQWAYVPFSKGSRNCIGQHLALIEVKCILTMTYREFRFKYTEKEPEEIAYRVTSVPKNGCRLLPVRRTDMDVDVMSNAAMTTGGE